MPVLNETTDAAASTATAYSMTAGDYFFGELSVGTESDWIEVSLTAGQTYTFGLVGVGALDDAANDTYLRLRDAGGSQIAEDDDGGPGRNSTITFTATSTGTYYLDVGSYVGVGLTSGDEGSYGLSMVLGNRASYDVTMGAGNLLRPSESWSATPGSGATVSWAIRASGDDGNGFVAPSAAQVAAISDSMAYIDAISGLTLTQVNPGGTSNSATMLFGAYSANDGSGAYAYYPGSTASGDDAGDVWLNNNSVSTTSLPVGSYSYFVMLHEIGHAIGLAHPGDYNAGVGVTITYANNAQFTEDTHQYTVMSYFDESNTTTSFGSYPDTLLLFDIYAIHQLYGADYSYHAGDTTYGFNATVGGAYDFTSNTDPFLTIWDGSGNDTLDVSGFSQNQRIDLREGVFSNIGGFTGNVSIAIGAVIENAVGGSGDDTIIGNAADNAVTGGSGTDTFDMSTITSASATVTAISGGFEVVSALGTDTLSGVEFIQFSDTLLDLGAPPPPTGPTTGNDVLSGTTEADTIDLLAGDDSYDAGTGNDSVLGNDGNDTLRGEEGNDTLEGGSGADSLVGGTGADTLRGGADNDTLLGNSSTDELHGEGGDDTLRGGDGVDVLYGGTGNDFLIGHNGWDSLFGGADDDVMYGSSGADSLDGGSGNDTLNGGTALDTLRGGDDDDVLYGNAGADQLFGDAGNDLLWGASGIDTLDGGANDDTLYGNEGADILRGNTGQDQLFGGTGDDSLTGDEGNDTLYGNQGQDTLSGGAGDDFLRGGTLADTFLFESGADVIDDFATFQDLLMIDSTNWSGTLTPQQLIDTYGNSVGDSYVLDFGGGNSITFNGGLDPIFLVDQISIF